MVGRVAADPQNNPAVRGDWTDHHLWATLAGLKKERELKCASARAPLVEGLTSPRRQPDRKTLAASLGKQGRLDYVNFGTYVPRI
jgi:hypothetical protein